MPSLVPLKPIDYLIIGHLSQDLTPEGPRLGGTAAYAALTARALGLRVGVVTAFGEDVSIKVLVDHQIQAFILPASHSTTFENVYSAGGRVQYLHHVAGSIAFAHVPQAWRHASIVHLGPIVQEVEPVLDGTFSPDLLGLTPQGWLRAWNGDGRVRPCAWVRATEALSRAGAAVISIEDVGGDEEQIEPMVLASRVLAVTEGPAGARLYWNGDLRRFLAPVMAEVDATGAGDIFAAAFFIRLYATRDPWEAARFATRLASFSVARRGLEGIPTQEEIQTCLVEVL